MVSDQVGSEALASPETTVFQYLTGKAKETVQVNTTKFIAAASFLKQKASCQSVV